MVLKVDSISRIIIESHKQCCYIVCVCVYNIRLAGVVPHAELSHYVMLRSGSDWLFFTLSKPHASLSFVPLYTSTAITIVIND